MQNKTFRAIGATAVLLGVAVAALAQVGPDDPSATETAPEVTVGASTTVAATTTVVAPSDYRLGLLAGITTDNFWEYIGDQPTVWNAYVLGPTKPSLFGIDPVSNALIQDLSAEEDVEPTSDADGWRVRVEIEAGLTWSDGEPITARDIVYTFDTVRRLGLQGGWEVAFPAEIEEIVADSDTQVRIELSKRPSLAVWPYGIGLAPIMPAHVWAPRTDPLQTAAALYELDGAGDVSGGPLQIDAVEEQRILSVANPAYSRPTPDTVTYSIYPDEASAVAALEAGEIDTVVSPNGLSAESIASLESADGVSIEQSPANSIRYLGFNLTREPMSAPAFRQALSLLLDREAATQSVVPDASAAYTMLSPANVQWFDPEQAAAIAGAFDGDLPERLSKVIGLLQADGYAWATPPSAVDGALSPGRGLTIDGQAPAPLTILTPGDEYDPARPDYTQRIEATLQAFGFEVSSVITDFDTVIDLAFTVDDSGVRQYDMYVLGWTLGNPARPDFYRFLFASDGTVNSTGYSDAEFDAQLARYEQATNVEEAKAALWEMEKTLAEDIPYLVLYHPDLFEAYRSDRLDFAHHGVLGGLQGRLGGIGDLTPAR
ncbi:MAG: ABC transporter substrate-binding protein [Acidimicrobiia bacterium]